MSPQQSGFDVDKGLIAQIARDEGVDEDVLTDRINRGTVVAMGGEGVKAFGIGEGLRTKINANIGTSPDYPELETELEKLHAAVAAGADAVMDLSTGGDLDETRRAIRAECPVVLGTVPVYQAFAEADRDRGEMLSMTADDLLDVIERNGADNVDFMTLHCGVTRDTVAALKTQPRIGGIVSRGGSLLAAWMRENDTENPLYAQYDDVLAILKEYNVAITIRGETQLGRMWRA
ncbi:MAG: phosphomethylpyrimidine synthase ThiC, partial [Armatimonadota bacterium]